MYATCIVPLFRRTARIAYCRTHNPEVYGSSPYVSHNGLSSRIMWWHGGCQLLAYSVLQCRTDNITQENWNAVDTIWNRMPTNKQVHQKASRFIPKLMNTNRRLWRSWQISWRLSYMIEWKNFVSQHKQKPLFPSGKIWLLSDTVLYIL